MFARVMRAIKLVDSIPGWTESCMAGFKIAFDAVSNSPAESNSILTQQIRTAALSQGLLASVPAMAGFGMVAGQQRAVGYAGQQGGVLAVVGTGPQLWW